ncbi:MAG: RagB/SusD family nutrient uptake outer membrane protein [Bacteroidetes bacterium]|nr:RagB/SusD family nutrient uptake outer membrane protein [Bacteroidota bacterium]
MKAKKRKLSPSLILVFISLIQCTSLEEKYEGNLTGDLVKQNQSNVASLTINLSNSLKKPFQDPFGGVISLSEITTDELIAPTRGTDWYDDGVWLQLHQHRWTGNHPFIIGCFNDLCGVVFAANDLLRFDLNTQLEAETRFYRAWAMYWLLDFFDQVPYRDLGESSLPAARVRKGKEALDYIINEVNSIIQNLSDGNVTRPTKNAAKVFLMKCYLNKAIYANRQKPVFEVPDMDAVIKLADEVISSNQFSFSDNYFDSFAPDNTTIGKENIFTAENVGGVNGGSKLPLYTLIPLHYKSTPFGFNGWATLSKFYDKFQNNDKRKGQAYRTPNAPPNVGQRINIGFLVGQQYNLYSDEPLSDGALPLVFTPEVKITESSPNLLLTGIRPEKYAIDFFNFDAWGNDWVYFRLPDVLLMKAEAILRGGIPTTTIYGTTALELVNAVRKHPSRSASTFATLDLSTLLDERGRELWLECWRRQDLIRFGKFLEPFQEKEYFSDPKYLIFPIPDQQLAVNKNLVQNPGY